MKRITIPYSIFTAPTIRRYAASACAALLLAACTNDDALSGADSEHHSNTPVTFNARVQATPATRTAIGANGQTVWADGDAVSVFMLEAGEAMPDGILTGADNVKYNVAASGALSPVGTPVYYPLTGKVDFIALYPYSDKGTENGKITDEYKYPISLTDQSQPKAIDVLYAKATEREKSQNPVALEFGHVLSKIKLDIKPGNGMTGLTADQITAVTITGMPASATLALQDGTLTPGTTDDISAVKEAKPSTGVTATFTALVPPQAADSYTRSVIVTVDGEEYTGTIPATDAYASNEMWTYPVTVLKRDIDVGEPEITPWTTNDHSTGTATEVGAGIEKVRIPAGTFQMGSPDTDTDAYDIEKPQHWVRLTKDFYLGKYEVTRTQYAEFLNATGVPETVVDGYVMANVKGHGTQKLFEVNAWGWTPMWNGETDRWEAEGDYPMIYVTWYGAKAYADWVGGRLPTEAEWEYACRAGTTTRYSFAGDASMLGDYAVYKDNKVGDGPSRVGTKMPNPWGLYDMHGNVFEWCMDSGDASANYPAAPTEADAVVNPQVAEGQYRMSRGGCWNYEAGISRSAYRLFGMPYNVYNYTGFRVAFSLSE